MLANVVVVEQGTEEWHEARIGRVTASRFADIMRGPNSASWKNYKAELVAERLSGRREEGFKNSAMQWGTEYEPVARLTYELLTGNAVEETGFFAHPAIDAGASPDGLIGEDGLLEIKCPNTATHIETLRKRKIPSQYYWQVQGQMWITERKWCDFVSFDPRLPENAQIFVIRGERNEEDIKELESTVREFLASVDLEVAFVQNFER